MMDPLLDKSQFKGTLMTIKREAIHMLKDDLVLVDVWTLTNPRERDYRFFFPHCPPSHTDFFLIANPLVNSVGSCIIKTVAITDHVAMELCINTELDMGKRTRWRMNTFIT